MPELDGRDDKVSNDEGSQKAYEEWDVTYLLDAWFAGNTCALDEVVTKLYPALSAIAAKRFQDSGCWTLEPAAVLNELYVQLRAADLKKPFPSSAAFRIYLNKVLRCFLLDYMKRKTRKKRAGTHPHVPIDAQLAGLPQDLRLDFIDLLVMLDRFETVDQRGATILSLQYLEGMTLQEIAELFGETRDQIKYSRKKAIAWLRANAPAPTK